MVFRFCLSLILTAATLGLFSSQAVASNSCDYRYGEFNDRYVCERTYDRCEWDGYRQCYIASSSGGANSCSEYENQFYDQLTCEWNHNRCEFDFRTQCYVPSRATTYQRPIPNQRPNPNQPPIPNPRPQPTPVPTPQATPQPTPPPIPVCRVPHNDGSYLGRGRMGFTSKGICEHAEQANHATCEQRGDGCWHPIGQ